MRLTQKPTSPNHRLPLTAFETHNGRSTFAAGIALYAPQPTFKGASNTSAALAFALLSSYCELHTSS
jgi:hypothetical protein